MDIRFSVDVPVVQEVDAVLIPLRRVSGEWQMDHGLLDADTRAYLRSSHFEGRMGEVLPVPFKVDDQLRRGLIVALPEEAVFDAQAFRLLGAYVAKQCAKHHVASLGLSVAELCAGGRSAKDVMAAFVEGMVLGGYRYTQFKGDKAKTELMQKSQLKTVIVGVMQEHAAELKLVVDAAKALAEATCYARDLVNAPANHMTPARLAQTALDLSDAHARIRVRVYSEEEMRAMGMHAALSVGQGSTHRPVLVHLRYDAPQPCPRIALVGKAVTFDSGGLSLKPADNMMDMKIDMSGAATVLGVFKALGEIGAPVSVDGIFIAVENMPSGTAYRPGDVVQAKNGMTIEVLNTDAEGRVTLADALSYATDLKPNAIIDLATLTGACVVALGDDIAGLMSNDTGLTKELMEASQKTAEPLWELPLHKSYNELIKSKVGDIKNIGGRAGGAITAGLFLQNFVNQLPWAHLDIAGPASIEKETSALLPHGGTGFGVRLLMQYLKDKQETNKWGN